MKPTELQLLSTLLSEPHRKYHNINHIHQCLVELENFSHPDFTPAAREIVEAAIWYHDAIYNPYSTVNEFNSSRLAFDMGQPNVVSHIIMLTSRHLENLSEDINTLLKPEYRLAAQVMLDIDLAGLGKDRAVFAANSMNIRNEYYNTSLNTFLEHRLQFWHGLNIRKSYYYTEFFRDKYQEKAEDNIKWEIALIHRSLDVDSAIWGKCIKGATASYTSFLSNAYW